jgi:hypothetical protein
LVVFFLGFFLACWFMGCWLHFLAWRCGGCATVQTVV